MKNNNKHSRKTPGQIIGLMTALLTTLGVSAQNPMRTPMVLGIVVEGLNEEYLELLEPHFVDGGFKRLMNKGVYLSDVRFGPGIDPTAATAIIYTGTSPMVNGIPSAEIYTPATNRTSPILLDAKSMGNFTDETYSPKAVKVSTISDEMRLDTDGDGMVYSVGPDPQIAIISAGHAANGAYWIYDHTGNWATTTYYKELPAPISNRNYLMPLRTRLDTMKWTPSMDMSRYPLLSRSERNNTFRHTYPKKQIDRYRRFKSSPMANKEVTDISIDLLTSSKSGSDDAPDMLNVQYTVNPSDGTRAETMDIYLRLDKELARLFEAVDRSAGAGNTTIFLSGLPAQSNEKPDNSKWQLPTGEYSVKKAMSLLDMYLMAKHGNGDWISGYNNKQFYLNRKLIADKNLSLTEFRAEVADFLARMAGVCNVYTIDDIIAARAGSDPQALKRNTSIEHCGDVIIEINPGWVIVDENTTGAVKKQPKAERMNSTRIPAFIFAPSLKPQIIDTPVDARAIAPAVARVLRIRPPNAAADGSLHLRR